jgi:hypothetical protein
VYVLESEPQSLRIFLKIPPDITYRRANEEATRILQKIRILKLPTFVMTLRKKSLTYFKRFIDHAIIGGIYDPVHFVFSRSMN